MSEPNGNMECWQGHGRRHGWGRDTMVLADPTVIATGLPVADDATDSPCIECGCRLQPGTPVAALLARRSSLPTWQIAAVACRACSLRPEPTPPAVVVTGTLSTCSHPHTQTHSLCLSDVAHESTRLRSPSSIPREHDR